MHGEHKSVTEGIITVVIEKRERMVQELFKGEVAHETS